MPKTWDSLVYQYRNILLFGIKSRKAQYEKGQKDGKDRKNKRSEKNKKGEKGKEGNQRNKLNLILRENSNFETSIAYYHINFKC